MRENEQRVRAQANLLDPPVTRLLDVIRSPARLWERRRSDIDFLRVRVGVGALPVRPIQLREQSSPTNPLDPYAARGPLADASLRTDPGLPLRVDLDCAGDISVITRDHDGAVALAGAILVHGATFHAPDDVTLAIVTTSERAEIWAWARWLPHLLDRTAIGPSGPTPLLVTTPETLTELLAEDLEERTTHALKALRHAAGAKRGKRARRRPAPPRRIRAGPPRSPPPNRLVRLSLLGIAVDHLLPRRHHPPDNISRRTTNDDEPLPQESRLVAAGPPPQRRRCAAPPPRRPPPPPRPPATIPPPHTTATRALPPHTPRPAAPLLPHDPSPRGGVAPAVRPAFLPVPIGVTPPDVRRFPPRRSPRSG